MVTNMKLNKSHLERLLQSKDKQSEAKKIFHENGWAYLDTGKEFSIRIINKYPYLIQQNDELKTI